MSAKRPAAHDADDDGASSHKSAKLTPPDQRLLSQTQALSTRAYIKRVRMRNFLPYIELEVWPGPRLNLVVGPNGSGKSTIVSAICLALAGGMKVMSRGGSAADYVRNGQEVGEIEVDLNDSQKKSGVISFKRRITRSTGLSQFWIDGKSVKEKDVKDKVKSLDVQLDNLCHFLPQEKVEEFGQLAGKPTEMLFKVEEAVGADGMKNQHEELISMQSTVTHDKKELENKLEAQEKAESKKSELEKLVETQEKWQEMTEKASLIQKVIPHRKYKEALDEKNDQKQLCEPLQKDLEAAKEDHEEKRGKERLAKAACKTLQEAFSKATAELDTWMQKLDDQKEKILNEETTFDNMKRTIKEHDKRVMDRETKKAKIEAELDDFKEKKAKQGKEPADLGDRINKANMKTLDLSKKVSQKHQQIDGKKKELRVIENEKIQRHKQVQDFRTVDRAKQQALMNGNRKVWEAWNWVRDNADRFEKPVLGPICLELSCKDRESAMFVESALSFGDKMAFIVQTDHDYSKMAQMQGAQGEGHPLKNLTILRHMHSNIPPDDLLKGISAAKKAEYGLQDTVINRVQASDTIKSWLCGEKNLHRRVTGSRKTEDTLEKLINDPDLIVTTGAGKKMHKLSSVITPDFDLRIMFSVYGNKQKSVTKEPSKPSQFILYGDDSKLEVIKQELQEVEATEGGVLRTLEVLEREDVELRTQHSQAQQVQNVLRQEKALYDSRATDQLISRKEKEIRDAAVIIQNLKGQLPELKRKYAEKNKKRLEEASKLKSFTDKVAESNLKLLIKELEVEPLKLEHVKLQSRLEAASDTLAEKQDIYEKQHQKLETLRKEIAKLKLVKEQAENVLTPEDLKKILPGKEPPAPPPLRVTDRPWVDGDYETAKEWQDALNDLNEEIAKIGAICDYTHELEDIKEELEALARDIPKLQDSTKNHAAKVAKKKDLWLDGHGDRPGLRSLIKVIDEYFSDNFAKLGNVGTVELVEAKHENGEDDFKNYGVNILVKFRAEQKLQALKAQVQSGGEKSLSCMLFLLSMQQITKCPFRVVDEINQGMDANFEKAVFERIVEWSSKSDTSQCFLITPKIQGGMLDNVGKNICVLNIFKGRDMCTSSSSASGPRGHF